MIAYILDRKTEEKQSCKIRLKNKDGRSKNDKTREKTNRINAGNRASNCMIKEGVEIKRERMRIADQRIWEITITIGRNSCTENGKTG